MIFFSSVEFFNSLSLCNFLINSVFNLYIYKYPSIELAIKKLSSKIKNKLEMLSDTCILANNFPSCKALTLINLSSLLVAKIRPELSEAILKLSNNLSPLFT